MGITTKLTGRCRRQRIIRNKITGTAERPRLNVYRSINHLYAQVIDDHDGRTIISVSTNSPAVRESVKKASGTVKGASILGAAVADLCKKKGITKVVFDRAGYMYHGRVKALAEAARKGGLQF